MENRSILLTTACLIGTLCLTASFSASAATIITESTYSDFANAQGTTNPLAPTDLGVFTNDTYIISGQVGWGDDRADAFTFSIAEGHVLQNVFISDYSSSLGFDDSHLYMNRGATLSFDPNDEIEFINFIESSIGTDLLQFDSAPGPQAAGSYTVQWQEFDGPSNYEMQFVVSAVPVPAAFWLMASGLFGLIGFAKRKSFKTS